MDFGKAIKIFLGIMLAIFFLIMAIVITIVGVGKYSGGGGTAVVGNGPSGTNWYSKDDVSLDGVRDTTLNGLQDLADWYKSQTGEDLLVTSGTDGNMHADGERGSHYSGDKLDVASDALENETFRKQFIEYAESKGIIVLDEYAHGSQNSTGGHLDLNFQHYNGSSKFGGMSGYYDP